MSEVARSWLFVPGDSERKLEKSSSSDADVLIYDLEDAVVPERRDEARRLVRDVVGARDRQQCVRVNPIESADCRLDLAAVMPKRPQWIMQPKVRSAACIEQLGTWLAELDGCAHDDPSATRIIAIMTENPAMALALPTLNEVHPRLAAITWGAEDLSAAIGARATRDATGRWLPLYEQMRSQTLLAARALDVLAIDTLFAAFRDTDGLHDYASAAERDGFDGMMAIHPAQTAPINSAFTPSPADITTAERVIAAFAAEPNAGAVQLDGRMLDRPHLVLAQKVLARNR